MVKVIKKSSGGFAIVAAIFLVVVLGALGTMMLTFFSAQQQSSALDILGSRAYQAARAGIEWAAYGVSTTAQGQPWTGCTSTTPATVLTIPANQLTGTLASFSVTVKCYVTTTTPGLDGAATLYTYSITSVSAGPNGAVLGSQDYVSRVITATMSY